MKALLLLLALSFVGCHGHCACESRSKQHVRVKKLSNHRYAYQNDDGFWMWYLLSENQASAPSSPASPYALPPGGVWAPGRPPAKEEIEEEQEAEVETDEEGLPVEEEVAEAEASELSEPAAPESVDSAEGAADSSGAGDVGGGGDTGGGDGGGGGGD